MADEEKQAEGAPEEGSAEPQKKKRSFATIGIFGGVMIAEGLGIFFAMKFFGSDPDPTEGMMQDLVTTAPYSESKEIEVAHVRVQNTHGSHKILYSVTFNVRVHYENESTITEFLKHRQATVTDSLSRLIRSATEEEMTEDGLETLKRKVRFELSSLLADDSIIEMVLISEFTPLPTGF